MPYTGCPWWSDSWAGFTWIWVVPPADGLLLKLPTAKVRWGNITNLSIPNPTVRQSGTQCTDHASFVFPTFLCPNKDADLSPFLVNKSRLMLINTGIRD